MGFDDITIKLATRPENFGGTIERWDAAEKALGDALRATGYDFEIAEGEGAFYAPKLEFHLQATPSAAPGSAARCSSTMCCPSGWTRPISPRTARASAR